MLNVPNLYEPEMMPVLHAVNQALLAHTLKKRDVDYVVKRDDDTGRKPSVMHRRRAHRAADARAPLVGRPAPGGRGQGRHRDPEREPDATRRSPSRTSSACTRSSAGMTGTADTEAPEFAKIYDLDVHDHPDEPPERARRHGRTSSSRPKREKYRRGHRRDPSSATSVGQPQPDRHDLDRRLRGALEDAHEEARREATTCSTRSTTSEKRRSSRRRAARAPLTISTNMAGRGTDIVLGGNAEMMALQKLQGRSRAPRVRQLASTEVRGAVRGRARRGARGRRAPHPRHRASREPAHRQPAARPGRPAGRPRLERSSSCRWRTTCCASSRASALPSGGTASASKRARRSRTGC